MSELNETELLESLQAEFIEEVGHMLVECEESILKLHEPASRPEELSKVFRVAHSIKGSAAAIGFADLSHFAHRIEDCLSMLRDHPELLESAHITLLLNSCDAIKARLATLQTGSKVATEWNVESLNQAFERVNRGLRSKVHSPARATHPDSVTERGSAPPVTISAVHHTLKVDAQRVEAALDLIGELVVIKSQIIQEFSAAGSANLRRSSLLNQLDRTVRDLQERTQSMRLTALKPLFLKVKRIVRELSQKLQKPVELRIQGEEMELDRTLIELLADPLVHLIRNALDHGIEAPERRTEQGKRPTALISLSARQVGGRIILEIRDDGQGIDKSKILARAARIHLIQEERSPESYSDEEVYLLLFTPGFSTAGQVTDVSGRGVGLDVVRSNVERMKGHIEIESAVGQGTLFRISLPLTTAVTDGIVTVVNGVRSIIPLDRVRELIELSEENRVHLSRRTRVADIRGRILPVVEISELLDLNGQSIASVSASAPIRSRNPMVLVLESQEIEFAVTIDGVLGQSQVVVKSLGASFQATRGVSGAAILGDGKVALVLDIDQLAKGLRRSHVDTRHSA